MSLRPIDELIQISHYAGQSLLLVQGGGGNGSVKDAKGHQMWIKASGFRMAEVGESTGQVPVHVDQMNAITLDPALAAMAPEAALIESVRRSQELAQGSLRPSMETGFHALLGRVVLHTHSVYVNAFACMLGGREALASVAPYPIIWIPYLTPGYVLSIEIHRQVEAYRATHGMAPRAIILENHGLIANADSAEEATAITEQFVRLGEEYFGSVPVSYDDRIAPSEEALSWADGLSEALSGAAVRVGTFRALVENLDHAELFASGHLIPDDIVYSGERVFVTANLDPARWLAESGLDAPSKLVVVVTGLGVFIAGPEKTIPAIEENLLAHVLVRTLINRRGQARNLPLEQMRYLVSTESEKYRQAVAAGQISGSARP